MYNEVASVTLTGPDTVMVTVETDVSDGLPMFDMVGFLGNEVREARERVRTAIKNSGYKLPPKRITVNISPANIRKKGTAFDLAIALSILACMGYVDKGAFVDTCIIGELSLDGTVTSTKGVMPRVMRAKESGYKRCIIPRVNSKEGGMVEGIEVIGVETLAESLKLLRGDIHIEPTHIDIHNNVYRCSDDGMLDFADINGQHLVKRALEIAASGFHNVLLMGPPGAGKTMAAKRLPSIMPPLDYDEIMELTRIYSIAGQLPEEGIISRRPFVSPHHTCSPQSLVGGGSMVHPGAVTLAHKAVLFLDELPEFRRDALEILRQPLEDKEVHIARAGISYTYPADFLLVAAMNPCRCGYYPDESRCSCKDHEIKNYLSKISGPLLDRIDICVDTPQVSFEEISEHSKEESSEQIRERVLRAIERQSFRFRGTDIKLNGQMSSSDIMRYCPLGKKQQKLLEEAFKNMQLSARAYHRILKVARTIADLSESDKIREEHLTEAIAYRGIDKKYWTK